MPLRSGWLSHFPFDKQGLLGPFLLVMEFDIKYPKMGDAVYLGD